MTLSATPDLNARSGVVVIHQADKEARVVAWARDGRRQSSGVAKKLAQRVLRRDHHECQINGPQCVGKATEVDHVVPVFEGGGDEPGNLRAVCAPCHRVKSQEEAQRARRRVGRLRQPLGRPQVNPFAPGAAEMADRWRAAAGRPPG